MKLDRNRATELIRLLQAVPSSRSAVSAIEAQLKNAANTEINVNESWVMIPALQNKAVKAFAATLNESSFEGFHEVVPQTPFTRLERFEALKHWDMDSTPARARALSRGLHTRPPEIEAAIILASLKHDVRYYYGGDPAMKRAADSAFAQEIRDYAGELKASATLASVVASVDELAVIVGGGAPFDKDYSWGYGLPQKERGFVPLADGQRDQIEAVAADQWHGVVKQLAADTFPFTAQHERILTPQIRANLRLLAQAMLQK